MTKTMQNKIEPSRSLLNSPYFQNALKFNTIESNKLSKKRRILDKDEYLTSTKYNRDWENTQKWLKDIKKSSGNSDLEKYNAYIEPKSKLEDKDKVPSYYFMYGMRIGERPQLMKNFLGKQQRTEKKKKDIGNTKVVEREEDNNMSEASYFTASSSQLKKDLARTKNNQIMVGDKVVIQVPIGYRQSCIRKHNWYDKCTSSGMKQENARIPQYYQQKYKNVILQDDMFT